MSAADTRERRDKADGAVGAIVFGPVQSRRYGRSLGINILPAGSKVCNFNCPYCECGWTLQTEADIAAGTVEFPAATAVLAGTALALEECREEGLALDAITLAGNGEPTLHPQFPAIAAGLAELAGRWQPTPTLVLLSNGTQYDQPAIREALEYFQERIVKIDAGALGRWQEAEQLARLVPVWRTLDRLTVQSCFVQGAIDNTDEQTVAEWIEQVAAVAPARVQVYSLDRPPADARLQRVPATRLEQIAAQLHHHTGLPVQVF